MNRKLLLKCVVCFVILLVACTILSSSVYQAKLPVVSVITGMQSTIEHHKTLVGELYAEGDTLFVRYHLPPDEAKIYLEPDLGKVSIRVVTQDPVTGNETVAGETLDAWNYHSTYDAGTDTLVVTAELTPPVGTPIPEKGATVTLSDGVYVPYLNVVPAYCIQQDAEGEFVWVLMERKSLFGVENYVLRTSVTIDARNESYAAFSYMPGTQVVASSSLPLTSGSVVVVG